MVYTIYYIVATDVTKCRVWCLFLGTEELSIHVEMYSFYITFSLGDDGKVLCNVWDGNGPLKFRCKRSCTDNVD